MAARVLRDGLAGAVVSFDLRGGGGGRGVARSWMRCSCAAPAPRWATSTARCCTRRSPPRSLSADERRRLGIGDSLVRLSVGIEEPEDVIADVEQALGAGARGLDT